MSRKSADASAVKRTGLSFVASKINGQSKVSSSSSTWTLPRRPTQAWVAAAGLDMRLSRISRSTQCETTSSQPCEAATSKIKRDAPVEERLAASATLVSRKSFKSLFESVHHPLYLRPAWRPVPRGCKCAGWIAPDPSSSGSQGTSTIPPFARWKDSQLPLRFHGPCSCCKYSPAPGAIKYGCRFCPSGWGTSAPISTAPSMRPRNCFWSCVQRVRISP